MTTTHFIADAGQHPTSPPGPTDGVTGPIGVSAVRRMAEVIHDHPGECHDGHYTNAAARWPRPFVSEDLGGAS